MISSHTKLSSVEKSKTKSAVALATTALMEAAEFAAAAERVAPGALGASASWTTGLKQRLAVAIGQDSKVCTRGLNRIQSRRSSLVDFTCPNLEGIFNVRPIERLGLPLIYGADGRIGLVGQGFPPGARFPAGPLVAATRNPDLAHRVL